MRLGKIITKQASRQSIQAFKFLLVTLLCLSSAARAQSLSGALESLEAQGQGQFMNSFNDMSLVINRALGGLEVGTPRVEVDGRSGVVALPTNLMGMPGELIFVADDNQGAGGHFLAFMPAAEFKFSDFVGGTGDQNFDTALSTLDSIKFDDALLVFANSAVNFNLAALDNGLATQLELDRFTTNGNLVDPGGVSIFGNFDVGASKFLSLAFEVVGFSEPSVLGRASVQWTLANALGTLVGSGARDIPELSMAINLPGFNPKFFGALDLNREFYFTFGAMLAFDPFKGTYATTVSMASAVDMPIGNDVLATTLALASTYAVSPASVSTTTSIGMSLADADGWEDAFGWGFLTINDFKIELAQKTASVPPSSVTSVKMGGSVLLGSKEVTASSAAALGPVIVPTMVSLAVNDGPDEIGSIALSDLMSLFEAMTKQKMPAFPDMAVTGIAVGEGPSIRLAPALLEVQGKMTIFGQNVLTIERGDFDPATGVDLYGYSDTLDLGPLPFPSGEFKVLLKISPSGIVGPDIVLTAPGDMFGASTQSLVLSTDGYKVVSSYDLGGLFNGSYEYGVSGLPQNANLSALQDMEAVFSASMASDVSGWINSSGKDAVQSSFSGLFDLIEQSTQALANANAEVEDLTSNISTLQAKISTLNNAKESCNQNTTRRDCVSWQEPYCKSKWRGNCVKWGWKNQQSCNNVTVPDPGARAVCTGRNVTRTAEVVALEAEKASLAALKVTAKAALDAAEAANGPMRQAQVVIDDLLGGLAALEVFSIQSASITGALSTAVATGGGDESALDAGIVYTVADGQEKTATIRFSLMDAAYTAKQMSVLLADAFVASLESQLGDDPATQVIVDRAKETLENLK